MTTALEKLTQRAQAPDFSGYGNQQSAKKASKDNGRMKPLVAKLKDGTFVGVGPVNPEDSTFVLYGKGCAAPAANVANLLSDEEEAPKPRKPRTQKVKEENTVSAKSARETKTQAVTSL